jgi:hypothetical protein
MPRKKRLILLAIGVLVLAVGGGVGFLFFENEPQTVSTATSPDGSWSVAVIAKPHMFSGSYDIEIHVYDAAGNAKGGGYVINLTSLDDAKKIHVVSFVDNKTAKVTLSQGGSSTIEKTAYFKE